MSDEPETSDEQDKATTKALMQKALRYVAMLAFIRGETRTPDDIYDNGTASFLQLPERRVIVTKHHVLRQCEIDRQDDPTVRLLLLGGQGIRPIVVPEFKVIDADEPLDLAVFAYDEQDEIAKIDKEFYAPKKWPLEPPKPNDQIITIGFPGVRRDPDTPNRRVSYEAVNLAPVVVAVGDRKIMCEFTTCEPVIHQYSAKEMTDRWGGMSGSMAYRLDEAEAKYHLTGFFQGAPQGLQGGFYLSRADALNENGTLRRA